MHYIYNRVWWEHLKKLYTGGWSSQPLVVVFTSGSQLTAGGKFHFHLSQR